MKRDKVLCVVAGSLITLLLLLALGTYVTTSIIHDWGVNVSHRDASRVGAIIRNIEVTESDGESGPAPTEMSKLVKWLGRWPTHDAEGGEVVVGGMLVDKDGRPLVLVVRDGRLAGIGACGPNGVWEGGTNDDYLEPTIKNAVRYGSQPAFQTAPK